MLVRTRISPVWLLASDFSGVYLVGQGAAPQEIGNLARGVRLLAANQKYIALAGAEGISLLTHRMVSRLNTAGIVFVATWCAIPFSWFAYWGFLMLAPLFQNLLERYLGKSSKGLGASIPNPEELRWFQPEPPEALIEEMLTGQCVPNAGAGLSVPAGFPIWRPYLGGLLDFALENKCMDERSAQDLHAALSQQRFDDVANGIASAMQTRSESIETFI